MALDFILELPSVETQGQNLRARAMNVWLYDEDLVLQQLIAEFESVIVTTRYREHSGWSGRFPPSAFDALLAARYLQVGDETEVFLVENVTRVTEGVTPHVTAEGRSATAMLHTRTFPTAVTWTASTAGEILTDVLASFTGDRALPLAFGSGIAIGSDFDYQATWSDAGTVVLAALASQMLGMRSRMGDGVIYLDVYAPASREMLVGEAYGDGLGSRIVTSRADWRNFAYVVGSYTDPDDSTATKVEVVVEVDQTGGGSRMELYVDGSSVERGELTDEAYNSLLAAEGASRLADTRLLDYAEAEVQTKLECGDVIWYDAIGWSGSFMVNEVSMILERGALRFSVALGEPPATLRKTLRRYYR